MGLASGGGRFADPQQWHSRFDLCIIDGSLPSPVLAPLSPSPTPSFSKSCTSFASLVLSFQTSRCLWLSISQLLRPFDALRREIVDPGVAESLREPVHTFICRSPTTGWMGGWIDVVLNE